MESERMKREDDNSFFPFKIRTFFLCIYRICNRFILLSIF